MKLRILVRLLFAAVMLAWLGSNQSPVKAMEAAPVCNYLACNDAYCCRSDFCLVHMRPVL